jgi:hypothetical protein
MAVNSRSPRAFMERAAARRTLRAPLPDADVGALSSTDPALSLPLPLGEIQHGTQGQPPPDRGRSREWHHGSR